MVFRRKSSERKFLQSAPYSGRCIPILPHENGDAKFTIADAIILSCYGFGLRTLFMVFLLSIDLKILVYVVCHVEAMRSLNTVLDATMSWATSAASNRLISL